MSALGHFPEFGFAAQNVRMNQLSTDPTRRSVTVTVPGGVVSTLFAPVSTAVGNGKLQGWNVKERRHGNMSCSFPELQFENTKTRDKSGTTKNNGRKRENDAVIYNGP